MKQKYGIILLDINEIIIRIYEADDKEWKLLHYHDTHLDKIKEKIPIEAGDIARIIADFLTTESAQHVIEWKMCARQLPQAFIHKIATATGLTIENLSPLREQELLSKGIFTELW
jgi:hypothetical protein